MAVVQLFFKKKLLHCVELNTDECTVGRNPDSTIFIDNLAVNHCHIVIEKKNALYFVRSAVTDASFLLNEKKGQGIQSLSNGDRIEIGKYILIFSSVENSGGFIEDFVVSRVARSISPEAAVGACLQIVSGKYLGRVLPLNKPQLMLGDKRRNSIKIFHRNGNYFARHIAGEHGLYLNGQVVGEESQLLAHRDQLELGATQMTFVFDRCVALPAV